jgi:hypothetical protein
MGVRYIFNTSGDYVAFVLNDNLFNPASKWLGVIRNGNEVYNTDGLFIGYLLEDDRIVSDLRIITPKRIFKPPVPAIPFIPIKPLRRLAMLRLPYPYKDVFEGAKANTNKLVPHYQMKRYDHLLDASIIAHDGTFLGRISKDNFDELSISNPYGPYGSPYSSKSIFNDYGPYGGEYSTMSPFNSYSTTPPRVVRDGMELGYLTVNEFLPNKIDTNEFLAWLNSP